MIEQKLQNLLLVALLVMLVLFTAYMEGYLDPSQKLIPDFSWLLWSALISGFAMAFWMACRISTARLLSMMLGIFIIEYVKEGIGINAGLWTYANQNSYNIGVWAWVLCGMTVFWVAVRLVIRGMRKLTEGLSLRWDLVNPIIVILVFAIIPLTLGKYSMIDENRLWENGQWWFWGLYSILFVVTLITAIRMRFPVFLGLLLTIYIIGIFGEYSGSMIKPTTWEYTFDKNFPPPFLIFGCLPLEIFTQYALAALLADELLEKYTFSEEKVTSHGSHAWTE